MHFNKVIFVFIILLASCTIKEGDGEKVLFYNEDDLEVLNGRVKQIETLITFNGSRVRTEEDIYTLIRFDGNGNETSLKLESHGNTFFTAYTTKYDKSNKKIETLGYGKMIIPPDMPIPPRLPGAKTDKIEDSHEVYVYNKSGQIVKYFFTNNPFGESYQYKYNTTGELIESDGYIISKFLMDVTKFEYDNNHLLIQRSTYHRNRLVSRVNYKYIAFDSMNNWLKVVVFPKDTITRKITYY